MAENVKDELKLEIVEVGTIAVEDVDEEGTVTSGVADEVKSISEKASGNCSSDESPEEMKRRLEEEELEAIRKADADTPEKPRLWKLKKGQKFSVVNGDGTVSDNIWYFYKTDSMYAVVAQRENATPQEFKYINCSAPIVLRD